METAITISWIAVVVAAVVRFAIGSAWYAPPVFGKIWQEAAGVKPDPSQMPKALFVQAIGDLIMAYVLARIIGHYGAETLVAGSFVGFMAWLGFTAPLTAAAVVFEQRPMNYAYVTGGFNLLSIVIMGAVISVLT